MPIADVYDFEIVIEPAIKALLVAQGLACITSRDTPTLQKSVPRVEVSYSHGLGLNKFAPLQPLIDAGIIPAGLTPLQYWQMRRESAWQSQINLELITKADLGQLTLYVTQVRAILANCWQFINGISVQTLFLQFDKEPTNGPVYSPQEGYYGVKMAQPIKVSVQADAWSALSS